MKLLVSPLELSEILAFAWTALKLVVTDYYRYYFGEKFTITTSSGPVKGHKIQSILGYQYINFIGIPYAKPPVGELRFKDPQPFPQSTEIVNKDFCVRGTLSCQADVLTRIATGSENCLHLSVFTHDIKPDKLKPVIVWIHGGVFLFGSNSKDFFNPEFLLRHDIVLVSINYRLGALGFTSFKDPSLGIPGNAGLKDQAMALKWVKENCNQFGGDSNNITLIGESAGAASVALHMISDRSKGLFHKAIMMSGSAFAPWTISKPGKPQLLAKKLGWDGEGGDAACLKILQQATPSAIVNVQEDVLTKEDRERYDIVPFGPVIEPYEFAQCFLSRKPKELMESAWSKHIPLIIGSCSNEGLVCYKMINKELDLLQEKKVKYLLPLKELEMDPETTECELMGKQLNQYYFGYSAPNIESLQTYMMLLGDTAFAHPVHRTIMLRTKYQYAPTYLLRFDFDSTYSLSKRLFGHRKMPGACHGDDFSYYFRTASAGPDPSPDTDEWKTIVRMCNIFTTFAQTGNPNNESIASIHWAPVRVETNNGNVHKYKCLNISNVVSFIDWPEADRMTFWDDVYNQPKNNNN